MEQMKEKAIQYSDGLLTSREFIGHMINLLGERWNLISENECNDAMANELAAQLAK